MCHTKFLEIGDETRSNITDDELKLYIIGMTGLRTSQDVASLSKDERNGILRQLCSYGAGVRQISRVTGVPYGIIYRINSKL
ncbi:MAG: hypothetical protein J5965_04810 [Aeriscardovia sp.]|nr:hypothetical protein [Aeriscardovia sp.]